MRIAIFGTGGIGGYYGGRLAQAGEEVTFIARGAHLQALHRRGLQVDSVKGDFVLHPVKATDDPATVGVVDTVILGVKTWQIDEAAQALRPLLGPDTAVVTTQNGVEAPAQLAAILGEQQVLAGVAKIFSYIVGPGHIHHLGGPTSLAFAELDNHSSERVLRLRQACERAGIGVETPADIHVALWEKFLLVIPFGGLGAVTRAPLGVLLDLQQTRALLQEAMQEVYALAQAHHIALEEGKVATCLGLLDRQPRTGTTSLQRDIMAGRPSELDAWNGAVVRLGQQARVATPVHRCIYHSLLPQELQARGQLTFPTDDNPF